MPEIIKLIENMGRETPGKQLLGRLRYRQQNNVWISIMRTEMK
jgi:hypothetical protein